MGENAKRGEPGMVEKRDGSGGGVASSSVSMSVLRRDIRALSLCVACDSGEC